MNLVAVLGRRLSGRTDSEHEQAVIRVVIVFLVAVYFLISHFKGIMADAPALQSPLMVAGAMLCFSILLLLSIIIWPDRFPLRRYFGMAADIGATSYVLAISGEVGTPLLAVYLWVIMGNGFRYGVEYLLAATAMSIGGFVTVYGVSDFWAAHTMFSTGFMIVLAVVPAYMAALLHRLHDAMARANEANKTKSQFLANMSHELRTPLNGVIGMTDLLADTRLNEEQKELAHAIQTSAHCLLDMIEKVLDISRIESGKLSSEIVDFDLHALVNHVSAMFDLQAQKKGVAFACHIAPDTPFQLRGDAQHLRQVLINLIGNAVKFTHSGGIDVRVYPVSTNTHQLRIRFEIKDTGIGIPEQAQGRIFEAFTQADSAVTRRYGGSGLGTAIAGQLVELMQGRIGLYSKEGAGSTFWFELPFDYQEQLRHQPVPALRDIRVLVFSGDAFAKEVSAYLAGWNVPFVPVQTTARALSVLVGAAARGEHFQVALVEQRQLDIAADQFAMTIRSEDVLGQLSLVLAVAAEKADGEALLQAGYSTVLTTPINKTLLFNALHAAGSEYERHENVVSLAEHFRQRSNARNLRVLVAEDNETNQKVLRGILERAGHTAFIVADGEEALDRLEEGADAYDLVILDVNMPGRSGLDVLKAYRFMDTQAAVPVIMLTADATPEAISACTRAGADAYLTKPVNARMLLDTIARFAPGRPEGERGGTQPPAEAQSQELPKEGVDEESLRRLERLGGGPAFLRDIAEGFFRDGQAIMAELHMAVDQQDYPRFQDAIHALHGSASELGGVRLIQLCKEARCLKPYDFSASGPAALVASINDAFNQMRTCLLEYINRQQDAMTE